MHYDLVDLKLFVAIADEGSVSRGAQRCHLAPSSASLRLKALEESFGTRLFTRQARGVIPNAAGMVMLEHARRCIAQLGQMHADMTPFSSGVLNHVTLFANNNAINSWLADDLLPFFRSFPSARIALEERQGPDIVAAVAQKRADVGIVAVAAEHPELDFLPYREDRLVVAAPPAAALARQESTRFAACLDLPFVCLLNGTAMHTYLINFAQALGRQLDVRMQVSGYPAVLRLIASGVGIGVVPMSALAKESLDDIVIVGLDEPWAARHHRLCVRPETAQRNNLVKELIATLLEAGNLHHGI
ncbi:LysR family transcriptional regulator [Bordetella petrii]|uniref:LysR family transcriptional regulator n=1 Tax=Bordetella petrii TaxID=94624 RepID=UPI001E5D9B1E|nr:LysR family transcriptional regulator [Bordetella petrii]MCD0502757.1 LysR family transcriptional regulator [Bordetella petrii]